MSGARGREGKRAGNISSGWTIQVLDRSFSFRGKSVSDAVATDLPPTVQKAHDLDAVVKDVIEGEILTGDQVPNAGRDVVPGKAGTWMFRELLPTRLGRIQNPIGGNGIVGGNFQPDRDQIRAGAIGANNGPHDQPFGLDGARRRASALTAAIVALRLGPLSSPSCTRSRSSSTV